MMTFSHLGALKRRSTTTTKRIDETPLDAPPSTAARRTTSGALSATAAAQRKQIVLAKAHLALNRRKSKLTASALSSLSVPSPASNKFERNASSMSNVSQNMAAEIRAAVAQLVAQQQRGEDPVATTEHAALISPPRSALSTHVINTPTPARNGAKELQATPLRTPQPTAIRACHQIAVSPPPSARGAALPCAAALTQLEAIDLDFVHALSAAQDRAVARQLASAKQDDGTRLRRLDSLPNSKLHEDVQLLASDSSDDDAEVDPCDVSATTATATPLPVRDADVADNAMTDAPICTHTVHDPTPAAPTQDVTTLTALVFADGRADDDTAAHKACFSCLVM